MSQGAACRNSCNPGEGAFYRLRRAVPSFLYVGLHVADLPPVALDRIVIPFPRYIRTRLWRGPVSTLRRNPFRHRLEYIGYNDTGTFLHSGGYHALNGQWPSPPPPRRKAFIPSAAAAHHSAMCSSVEPTPNRAAWVDSQFPAAYFLSRERSKSGTPVPCSSPAGPSRPGPSMCNCTVPLGGGRRVLRTGAFTIQSPG